MRKTSTLPAALAAVLMASGAPAFAAGRMNNATNHNNTWADRFSAGVADWTKVSTLAHPAAEIFGDSVRDRSGAIIGEVSSIETGPRGRAQEVEVTLDTQSKVARLPARDLRYSPQHRALDSTLSNAQIDSMAG